ncbi:MAG: D-tyrosyl-tRNA(Tyr) deacylase [Candidatus Marinimicrobia bacterium]|nr:D-tyrosyl-tRNA(Tyr) deacylase [Candidatus Neomarinimicrobiota bacterium]|tara:strand:- start:2720 stop:3163 length:444 start_codon:yes stop_codon:yes gene_type:complete
MVTVIQRCISANVKIKNKIIAEIDQGAVILLGIVEGDQFEDADYIANKFAMLRIYNDHNNKMNLSIKEIKGSVLVISQFTLCASLDKGRRPSFLNAASPSVGEELYQYFISTLIENNIQVKTGKFGADMDVELINQGPATFILDSKS